MQMAKGRHLVAISLDRFECGCDNDVSPFRISLFFGDLRFHTKSKSRLVSITQMTTRTSKRNQPLIMCLAYPKYDRLMIGGNRGKGCTGSTPQLTFCPAESQLGKINLAKILLYFTVEPSVLPRFDEGLTVALKSNLCTNNVAIHGYKRHWEKFA